MTSTSINELPLPSLYKDITPLQKLSLLKVLRPEKVMEAVVHFISESPQLGPDYVHFPSFDL